MSLWHVSAYWPRAKPDLEIRWLKPKLGSEGATIWNAGLPFCPLRRGRSFVTSMKDPGPESD